MKLRDTAAIVTGGASGLGAATARHLAGAGARVAILDRDVEASRAVAEGLGGLAVECDVCDAASGERAFAEASSAQGPARVLVNCAGIAPPRRIVGRDGPLPLEEFDAVVRVNLTGTFNMIRLAAAGMSGLEPDAEGERGVIVNTASVAAYEGQIGQAAYAASKGGVVALTIQSARELASRGIRVVTIAPGIFETPMLKSLPAEVQESLAAAVPFPRRLGRPEEFARLVGHIVDNPMLNGEVIRLDGAIRMPPR